jgi:hypothetical protein
MIYTVTFNPAVDYVIHLEDIELEVGGFRHVPEHGMVRRLLSDFHLAQFDICIFCSVMQHIFKIGGVHEMRAGAGGEVAAALQQAHGAVVYLPVAALGGAHGAPALGEGGRVEDDEVVGCALLAQARQQLEDVGGEKVHLPLEPV